MKYLKQILVASVVAMGGCFSSCDYLNVDDYFMDTFNYDSIFANKINVDKYVWNIPTYFSDPGAIYGDNNTPGVHATDESIPTYHYRDVPGMKYALGLVTQDEEHRFFDNYSNMYKIIRKVNIVLQNIDKVPDMTTQERSETLGYLYFMRAYAYYQVLVDFGPLLLIGDEVYPTNEEMAYYDKYRATYDESVEYVCTEFEKAAGLMPTKDKIMNTQFGRPSRDAALALVARLRLIHASEAFNGGPAAHRYFGDFKRSVDGVYYVNQTPDNARWAVAAEAAHRLLGKYKLHTIPADEYTPELPANVPHENFPNGAGGIDPYKSYKEMFNGETLGYKNPEFIWGCESWHIKDWIRRSFPVKPIDGWGANGVPQKMVDAYYMVDGTDYFDAHVDEQAKMDHGKSFSGYDLMPGTSEMYNNREPRFYANIGFQNRLWKCNSTTEHMFKNVVANYAIDGNCGKAAALPSPTDYTLTGYVVTKYIHDDDAYRGNGSTQSNKYFPIIRYAEILISYAEALNNIEGTQVAKDLNGNEVSYTRDYEQIKKCFNQIRYRAGLPGLPESDPGKDKINELIIRERMLEFFHENRRYYDVRRWGIYDKVDAEPVTGMNIEATTDNFFQRVRVNHVNVKNRETSTRLVLVPFWNNETRKMPHLDQNPGWHR